LVAVFAKYCGYDVHVKYDQDDPQFLKLKSYQNIWRVSELTGVGQFGE
jgi:hypothetical protein